MFTCIRNATVFSPDRLGIRDILLAGDKIALIGEPGSLPVIPGCRDVDATGMNLIPGLIDGHVHVAGGGGEGGFATRTPEITVEELLGNGITTVIGLTGTDGITRSQENLYAKVRSLREQGVSAFMLSGSYQFPLQTLTGDIRRDLLLVEPVLGAGELAVSDHRGNQITFEELARLAGEVRVAGLLTGKAGVIVLHLGDHPDGLALLQEVLARTAVPRKHFIPTHVNRNPRLLKEAAEYGKAGGWIDLTSGFASAGKDDPCIPAEEALEFLLERQVPMSNMLMSSDAQGSAPVFDGNGRLLRLEVASCRTLFEDIGHMMQRCGLDPETVLPLVTSNPARAYGLSPGKGTLAPGSDADLVLCTASWELFGVWHGGRRSV